MNTILQNFQGIFHKTLVVIFCHVFENILHTYQNFPLGLMFLMSCLKKAFLQKKIKILSRISTNCFKILFYISSIIDIIYCLYGVAVFFSHKNQLYWHHFLNNLLFLCYCISSTSNFHLRMKLLLSSELILSTNIYITTFS